MTITTFAIAVLGALLFPFFKGLTEKIVIYERMRNLSEGFFHSSARHSVHNFLRIGELCKDRPERLCDYNLEKQSYDTKLIESPAETILGIFPPQFNKLFLQYQLLSRNFNSDLNSFIDSRNAMNDEEILDACLNLNEKNIRLFQISASIDRTLEKLRRSKGFNLDIRASGQSWLMDTLEYIRFAFAWCLSKSSLAAVTATIIQEMFWENRVSANLQKTEFYVWDDFTQVPEIQERMGKYLTNGNTPFSKLLENDFDMYIAKVSPKLLGVEPHD